MKYIVLLLILGGCGKLGKQGLPGDSIIGESGSNGTSCSVTQLKNGAEISCSDGSYAIVRDGKYKKKDDDCKGNPNNHGNDPCDRDD